MITTVSKASRRLTAGSLHQSHHVLSRCRCRLPIYQTGQLRFQGAGKATQGDCRLNLSGVIEYRYADSHGAGHGLADVIGEAAFAYMTSLSHCCGTHRGECAAELVGIGIVFQQLLVASRGGSQAVST